MENNIDTVIGANVNIKGNLFNKGPIQVNGIVEGEIKSDENILIGETAIIKGPVIAKKIEISGEVKGLIQAYERLDIQHTGRVYGDINTKTLIIKEGAIFIGQSMMQSKTETHTSKETAIEDEKQEQNIIQKDKVGFFGKK